MKEEAEGQEGSHSFRSGFPWQLEQLYIKAIAIHQQWNRFMQAAEGGTCQQFVPMRNNISNCSIYPLDSAKGTNDTVRLIASGVSRCKEMLCILKSDDPVIISPETISLTSLQSERSYVRLKVRLL